MEPSFDRALRGFAAGVVSFFLFHQGMWELLHVVGVMPPAFPMGATAPLGVPQSYSLAFWAGIWGALFGWVRPRLGGLPLVAGGFLCGMAATVFALFVVFPIKGLPLGNGFTFWGILIPVLINGAWGIGLGLLLPYTRRTATG